MHSDESLTAWITFIWQICDGLSKFVVSMEGSSQTLESSQRHPVVGLTLCVANTRYSNKYEDVYLVWGSFIQTVIIFRQQ